MEKAWKCGKKYSWSKARRRLKSNLKFTRHGPVLWDDGKRALALRWVGSEPGTAGYLASLAIDRAENWEQFEAAMARWKVPSENIVYADNAGNIGEHSAGLAPMRNWTGLLRSRSSPRIGQLQVDGVSSRLRSCRTFSIRRKASSPPPTTK